MADAGLAARAGQSRGKVAEALNFEFRCLVLGASVLSHDSSS
ncbi:MAG TPA: hypothetical protein VNE38_08050 [Ktedonobacteraceae bacterium]|nr:hypothetical protein [Ktedonobacteraceae bacterium]